MVCMLCKSHFYASERTLHFKVQPLPGFLQFPLGCLQVPASPLLQGAQGSLEGGKALKSVTIVCITTMAFIIMKPA